MNKYLTVLFALMLSASIPTIGQTTEFTYQGRLLQNSLAPTANYDFEFKLFDAVSGGTELGSIPRPNVNVNGGVFTVSLDFGLQFDGSSRFLEISVKPAGSPDPLTVLTPRQPVSSAPYAIRSLNSSVADTALDSDQLGGVNASQYVQTNDGRLSDARPPTAGSGFYIQNGTIQQTGANFNIDGTGRANIFDATTQYNIAGTRVFATPGTSTFLGNNAGINNVLSGSTGYRNVFVGNNAGLGNTNGYYNTFIGDRAGEANETGISNTFVGSGVGIANTTGINNSFFGNFTGIQNQTGGSNSFFGQNAGFGNVSGSLNTFIGGNSGTNNIDGTNNLFLGYSAASNNTSGSRNTFVGTSSGDTNVSGNDNTLLGYNAETGSNNLIFATAIGAGSVVTTSNTIQLGRDGSDLVRIGNLGAATSTSLCINPNNILSACSVDSSQYVVSTDPRLSDARTPTAGSGFYIQNTTSQQTANFNVSGTGTANIFNAGTQFNLNNSRILSSPGTNNTFVGIGTGLNISTGARNTFVGKDAGINTTDGSTNTFVGSGAGFENTSGTSNSFFGFNSGLRVTSGTQNSVFGVSAGSGNLISHRNSMFGYEAGFVATGSENSFFGANAGRSTTSGTQNSFFGFQAGSQFTTGSNNTFIGENAGRNFSSGSNNTFLGAETGRNSQFTGNDNTLVGYNARLDGANLSRATAIGANAVAYQDDMIAIGGNDSYVEILGDLFAVRMQIQNDLNVSDNITANGVTANGLRITSVSAVSSNNLCINTVSDFVGLCSSSARFKKNVEDFRNGFDLIKKLRPVSFRWKDSNALDLGLVAEEVAEIEPLLTVTNKEGQIQGVKYDRIGVVLINVVKEQQAQIETQSKQIELQQKQIDALNAIVCKLQPQAGVCKEAKK